MSSCELNLGVRTMFVHVYEDSNLGHLCVLHVYVHADKWLEHRAMATFEFHRVYMERA